MDAAGLVERVREESATELDRLGSDKALIALTGADLSTATVLEALASEEAAVAATLGEWAEEGDGRARDAFERAAAQARERRDRLAESATASGADSGDASEALTADALDDQKGTVRRAAAGLIAWPLVADRLYLQGVSFFVNEADDPRADLCRDLRSECDESLAAGRDLLDAICEGGEWDRAEDAATEAISGAYRAYADRLEAMGLDPKPIC